MRKKTVRFERYKVWVVFEKTPFPAELVKIKDSDENDLNSPLEVLEEDEIHIEVSPISLDDYSKAPHLQNYLKDHNFSNDGLKHGYVLDGFPEVIKGTAKSPSEDDVDCDFVALSPHGRRWPVMINFREIPVPPPPVRDVDPTNCEIFGPDGESRGRAFFSLSNPDGTSLAFFKAFLADSKNTLHKVLVSRVSHSTMMIKYQNR